jgi:hypothetical protein
VSLWLVGVAMLADCALGGPDEASWLQKWRGADVPASLHAVFSLEEGSSAAGRLAAVAALPATLTEDEAAWLRTFLRWNPADQRGSLAFTAQKHEMASALRRCFLPRGTFHNFSVPCPAVPCPRFLLSATETK